MWGDLKGMRKTPLAVHDAYYMVYKCYPHLQPGAAGSWKGGRPNTRWIDFIKEVVGMSLQRLDRPDEARTWWPSVIHESPGVGDYPMAHHRV